MNLHSGKAGMTFGNNKPNVSKKPEKKCCAERRKLLKQVKVMRETLEQISEKDDLLEANPGAFGLAAARRMQEQAKMALKLTQN